VGIGSAHSVISASRLDPATTQELHAATSPGEDGSSGSHFYHERDKARIKNGNHRMSADAKADVEGGSPFTVKSPVASDRSFPPVAPNRCYVSGLKRMVKTF